MAVHAHVLGAHQPARLRRVIPQQRPDLRALADRQRVQQRFAALLIELGDQIRRVIGSHPRHHHRDVHVGALADELDLVLVVELLEHIGLELAVVAADRLHDLLTLTMRRRLDQVGDLRRMKPGAASGAHPQRTLGTCPTNGSMLAQSTNVPAATRRPSGRGSNRRSPPRAPVSTPTTRHQPSTRASSISFARTKRAPSTLINW